MSEDSDDKKEEAIKTWPMSYDDDYPLLNAVVTDSWWTVERMRAAFERALENIKWKR
jgi:hypothetical protein